MHKGVSPNYTTIKIYIGVSGAAYAVGLACQRTVSSLLSALGDRNTAPPEAVSLSRGYFDNELGIGRDVTLISSRPVQTVQTPPPTCLPRTYTPVRRRGGPFFKRAPCTAFSGSANLPGPRHLLRPSEGPPLLSAVPARDLPC